MAEGEELKEEPCIFCTTFQSQASNDDWMTPVKEGVLERYNDVSRYGFHCDEKSHMDKFHELIGHRDRFNCCFQLAELNKPYTPKPDFEDSDLENLGYSQEE